MGRFYTLYKITILNVQFYDENCFSLFCYPVLVFVVLIVLSVLY